MNRMSSPTMPPLTKAISESSTVQRAAQSRLSRMTEKVNSDMAHPLTFGKTMRPMPRSSARVPTASSR